MPWERQNQQLVIVPNPNASTNKTEDTEGVETKPESQANTEEKSVPWGPQRKKRRLQGYKEDPYVFFDGNEEIWQDIKKFYEVETSKEFNPTLLLTRCVGGKKKNIYFCSEPVKNLVQSNEHAIKIINTGVKAFVRCDNRNMKCQFRLANEGLGSISQLIGEKRRVHVSKEDLITLLQNTDPTNPPKLEILSEQTVNNVTNVAAGSCLLVYNDESEFTLILVGWRGTNTLRAYTDINDSVHMLRLLGADVSKYDVNKFKKNDAAKTGDNENGNNDNDDTNQDELVEGEDDLEEEAEAVNEVVNE